jgi:preprotein translocase SecE subunit
VSKKATSKKASEAPKTRTVRRPSAPAWLRSFGGYFKGAWQELRMVRWPNRRATWGLTLAVILFSVFFAAIILGLDTLFQYLFKEILL